MIFWQFASTADSVQVSCWHKNVDLEFLKFLPKFTFLLEQKNRLNQPC